MSKTAKQSGEIKVKAMSAVREGEFGQRVNEKWQMPSDEKQGVRRGTRESGWEHDGMAFHHTRYLRG